ncbi:MAG: hypothetical protein KGJ60_08815 [Verrucomicrobiota bacterium]|nr:hypothetical protein [Verrucomicrobiota bacterium]
MNCIGISFLSASLLIISVTSGCTSYRERQAFLTANSLDAFIADRPQAANLLRQHPVLEQWLRTEWNRPIEGYRIYWSDEEPAASPMAEHVADPHSHLIAIRVSKTLLPVDQLLALSYETCNAQGRSRFEALFAQAAAAKLTREDFVNAMDETEYAATLRVKEGFSKLLPLSSNEVARTTLYRKLLEIPIGFHEFQAWSIRTHSSNYFLGEKLYGQLYDRLVKTKQQINP